MSNPEYIRIASLLDVPAGKMKAFELGQKSIAIYNVAGDIYATDNLCSHDEAYLADGWLDGDVVTCPAHGAEFCVKDGAVLTAPATQGVTSYAVRVEGDDVLVAV